MKKIILSLTVIVAAFGLSASEAPARPAASSPEFARMKSLVGDWSGKVDIGQGLTDMKIQYRLLAGGSVLEERIFPGTTNEMVTMYFEKNGRLALTHYCMFGNRPGMLLKSSDSKTMSFEFDTTCGINPATESHMNALSLTFEDADTITSKCKSIIAGKPMDTPPTILKRIRS